MKNLDLRGLEERLNRLLDEFLNFSEAQIDDLYKSEILGQDSKEKFCELTDRAAALCRAEGRSNPAHLEEALAAIQQLELPLEYAAPPTIVEPAKRRLLLIDQDAIRLLKRRKLFLKLHVYVESTASLAEGLEWLETGVYQMVIVDYRPNAEEEDIWFLLQRFNLQLPLINVSAWQVLFPAENRHLNRDLLRLVARLFGQPVPRRLPPKSAAARLDEEILFSNDEPCSKLDEKAG